MTIRVLLVDDHRMLVDALCTMLAKEPDIEVVGEASDGMQMMLRVPEVKPDVVVLDIAMPDQNGIDACARLLARHADIKVVALSSYSDKRFVLQMLKAGASAYVLKAAAATELVHAIRVAATGQSYLSPEAASAVIDDITTRGQARQLCADPLGRREREVLQLLAEGKRSMAIAKKLRISVGTVDAHRRNIMRKLGLHTIAELTRYAIREGITAL